MTPMQFILMTVGIVILTGFYGLNLVMNGFLFPYIMVKISRGKKVLVEILTPTRSYFKSGKVEDATLVFKDANREKRTINISAGTVSRKWGVDVFVVDEEKNCLLKRDLSGVSGFDAVKFSNIVKRALSRPTLDDTKIMIILVVVFVILIAVVFVGWRVIQLEKMITALNTVAQTTGSTV